MNQEVAGLPGNSWWESLGLEPNNRAVSCSDRRETPGTVYKSKAAVVR